MTTTSNPHENSWAASKSEGMSKGLGRGQGLAPQQPHSLTCIGGSWLYSQT